VSLTVRAAEPGDAEAIAALLGQLGYPVDSAAIVPRLERLAIVGDTVAVAELDAKVVGLAHLQVSPAIEHDRPAAKVGALVVDESSRRRGVGKALIAAMEAEARSRGCGLLYLTTSERRDDAHAFYEQVGLQQTGRRYGTTLSQ
jgi:GNAT superfamily N-acetyltransferase